MAQSSLLCKRSYDKIRAQFRKKEEKWLVNDYGANQYTKFNDLKFIIPNFKS